ncbi:MAG: DUF433 domain-containing protein [Acidobacteria bacterium]|nr:DUF433 domain-containing protein [Acidobacteriota bacterium]
MRGRLAQAHRDFRERPAYTLAEAAHYLGVPVPTIRYWATGRDGGGALIATPAHRPTLLSFLNVAELHVLAAVRRQHGVSMPKVRSAIQYLARHTHRAWDRRHPLISARLETDGLDLFMDRYGRLVSISQAGQTIMREVMTAALQRIERDDRGVPARLYPFTRNRIDAAPLLVVIDPTLAGGRPVIAGTGLATGILAERYKAGESVGELARDYGLDEEKVEEAIRCELPTAA